MQIAPKLDFRATVASDHGQAAIPVHCYDDHECPSGELTIGIEAVWVAVAGFLAAQACPPSTRIPVWRAAKPHDAHAPARASYDSQETLASITTEVSAPPTCPAPWSPPAVRGRALLLTYAVR
jgi:hypothetical protein